MKLSLCLAFCLTVQIVELAAVTPVSKVLQLLSSLESKITKDGEAEEKLYQAYMDWCKTAKADTGYEIKTAKAQIEDLASTIGKAASDIDVASTKIEELAGSISQDTADLKSATEIRAKEKAEFTASEEELVEAVDMLDRAINILEKKLRGSASLMQSQYNTKDMKSILSALNAVVDAASLSLHDKQKLLSLAQSQTNDEDEDGDVDAPAAATYKSHSGSIIDVLEDMREKAQGQLAEIRKEESNAAHNFAMLKQSLEDEIAFDSKSMDETKANKAAAAETKAVAEGDMAVTKKDLADDEETLANMDTDCATQKESHEASVKSRAEELQALAKAKEIIAGSSGGASSIVYSAASFLQVDAAEQRAAVHSQVSTQADLVNLEIVNLVRQLATKMKSTTLMQLAGRISAAFRHGSAGGEDPFAKVKKMISEMLTKLEADAKSEANHKEYCDKELGATKDKMDELSATIEKLSAKKDRESATSAKLKGEIQELQSELAIISKAQAEADEFRREEHKAFVATKADLEQGLEGIRMALKILHEYYANDAALVQQPESPGTHSKAEGAGEGIIAMLEVIEGDFGKNLAEAEVEEDTEAAAYQKSSMINKLTRAQKEKDVDYKTKEAASLDKSLTEVSSDIESAQSELDAILEYNKGLIAQCVAKPETYDERKGRREAEVAGLKEALKILEGQAVLLQSKLRGASVMPYRQ